MKSRGRVWSRAWGGERERDGEREREKLLLSFVVSPEKNFKIPGDSQARGIICRQPSDVHSNAEYN